MKNFNFNCPHCNATIDFNDIKNHNKERLDEYLESLRTDIAEEERDKIKRQFIKEKEDEIKIKSLEFKAEIEKLKTLLDQSSKEKEKIKEDVLKDAQIKYSEEITSLKSKLLANEKENALNLEKRINLEREKFNEEIIKLKDQHATITRELEVANAQNKLMLNKTKGENWEIEVESELRKCFGDIDKIEKANQTNDGKKPDFLQHINSNSEREIGLLVYEVKNAKWSNAWEKKLHLDVINNSGNFGILVATSFEEKFKGVPFIKSEEYDEIWITNSESFVFVAQMLRKIVITKRNYETEISKIKKTISSENDQELLRLKGEYDKKIERINEFINSDIQKYVEICRTELNNLEGVCKSLKKQEDVVEKAHERIRKSIFDKLLANLYEILDDKNS